MTPNTKMPAIMNKVCMFRYEVAFVVGVTKNRWHQSQSDAFRKINECALVTALESFSPR